MCTKLLKWELRMKRPLALAGRTPISSSVRIVDAPAAVGVGSGEPWRIGGGGGADGIARIEAVSGPFDVVAGRGRTATPPAGVADAAAAGPARRWGRRALLAGRPPTRW